MKKLCFGAIAGILTLLVLATGFFWQMNPEFFQAKSLSEVICNADEICTDSASIEGVERAAGTPDAAIVLPGNTAEEKIDSVSLQVINIILYICGTISGVMIIVGGLRYVISTGDEDMMSGAKKTITWAVLGLLMTILAWAIVLNVARITMLNRNGYEDSVDGPQNPINESSYSPGVIESDLDNSTNSDLDGDGVINAEDNCVDDANPDQADSDGDGIGDVCDAE